MQKVSEGKQCSQQNHVKLRRAKQSWRMLLSGVTMSSPFIALHYGHNQMEDHAFLGYIVDAEQFPYNR